MALQNKGEPISEPTRCKDVNEPSSPIEPESTQFLSALSAGMSAQHIVEVYLCEKLSLVNEMYFAITLDRSSAGPVIAFLYTAMRSVDLGFRTALIVTPVNMLHNWRQEFLKWKPADLKHLRALWYLER